MLWSLSEPQLPTAMSFPILAVDAPMSDPATVAVGQMPMTQDDRERHEIDSQISKLEDGIRALKSRRNQLASISRLPPEILSKVFIANARWASEPLIVHYYQKRLSWVNVTHVSRHWRAVGLSCPQLWSEISCTPSPWTAVMFERSKHVPLALTLLPQNIPTDIEGRVTAAMSQPRRLRSLKITSTSDFVKKQLQGWTSASLLQTLILETTQPIYGSFHPLPDGLLKEGAPALRHVQIVGWTFSWALPILSGLTTLKLSNRSHDANPPNAADFIGALERMPGLEELDLDAPLPMLGASTVGRIVPMASIKKLVMKGPLKQCAGALKHMALPESAILKLTCSVGHNEDLTAAIFASILISSWLSAPLSTTKTLNSRNFPSCRIETETSTTIHGWFNETDFWEWLDPATLPFSLTITSSGYLPFTRNLISNLPLKQLHSLKLGQEPDTSILLSLSRLPSLKSVFLTEDSASTFIDFLKSDPTFQNPSKDVKKIAVTYFRALELLSFQNVNFCGEYDLRLDGGIEIDDLLDLLMWRYEFQGEIQKIGFVTCTNFFEHDFEQVEEIVIEAHWDGEEDDCPPDDEDDEDHIGCGYGYGCDCCGEDYGMDESYDSDDYHLGGFW